jgi:DNA-binding NtrC family response regulator
LSILLVEDETMLRELLTEFLVDAGYSVASCDSGEAARAMLAGGFYDVVVADNALAGSLTGAELLCVAEAQHPLLGLVWMSGNPHPPEGLPERAVFVPKPYTSAALLSALTRAISS